MAKAKQSKGEKQADETVDKAETIAAHAEDALEDQAEATQADAADRPTGERSHPPE